MKKHAAFVMFKTNDLVMMILRKDHTWGFPGGKQEDEEALPNTVRRECLEETDIHIEKGVLEYIGWHGINADMDSHLFVYDTLKHSDMKNIVEIAISGKATHHEEVCGVSVFDVDKTIFSKMPLAPTVWEELVTVFGERIK